MRGGARAHLRTARASDRRTPGALPTDVGTPKRSGRRRGRWRGTPVVPRRPRHGGPWGPAAQTIAAPPPPPPRVHAHLCGAHRHPQPGAVLEEEEKNKWVRNANRNECSGDGVCFAVKTWAGRSAAALNNGWRLAAVGFPDGGT